MPDVLGKSITDYQSMIRGNVLRLKCIELLSVTIKGFEL